MKAVSYAGTTFGRCSIIYFFQSRGSLFFLSCSCHHLPEVLCIELTGNVFESKIYGMSCVPYNKLLTNLACLSCTGEYWPSVIFVRTSRCLVHTVTTSGQYSPVRPLRSVSKRLLFTSTFNWWIKVLLWSKYSLLLFLQILQACLFDTSLAKSWASNFIQRLFSLSASLGFHGPPLFTFKTDWLDFRGLDRG